MSEALMERLSAKVPRAQVVRLKFGPVFGAALLALNRLGVQVDRSLTERWEFSATDEVPTVSNSEESDVAFASVSRQDTLPATSELDTLSTMELLAHINEQDQGVALAVREQLRAIREVVRIGENALRSGGRIVYVGAGTSGRLGVLDAAECPPTYGWEPGRFVALLAGGPEAMAKSVEGAEDGCDGAVDELNRLGVGVNDVVIGIAASGTTPYTLGALRFAHERGARTVGLTTTPGSPLALEADAAVVVPVGPEVLAGSTRMKAGTAQKLVLNMLSTALSVRLGRVYGNLMVGVQATNTKLKQRAVSIVQVATGRTCREARHTLQQCEYNVRAAIICLRLGVEPAKAVLVLQDAQGSLRRALGEEAPLNDDR